MSVGPKSFMSQEMKKKAFPIFYVDVTKTVYKSLRNILSFCIIETNQ